MPCIRRGCRDLLNRFYFTLICLPEDRKRGNILTAEYDDAENWLCQVIGKEVGVHPEIVDFGPRQGRRILATAGVAALRRGLRKSENAVWGQKMLFLGGH